MIDVIPMPALGWVMGGFSRVGGGDGHLAGEASKGLSKCTPVSPEPWDG